MITKDFFHRLSEAVYDPDGEQVNLSETQSPDAILYSAKAVSMRKELDEDDLPGYWLYLSIITKVKDNGNLWKAIADTIFPLTEYEILLSGLTDTSIENWWSKSFSNLEEYIDEKWNTFLVCTPQALYQILSQSDPSDLYYEEHGNLKHYDWEVGHYKNLRIITIPYILNVEDKKDAALYMVVKVKENI